MRIILVGFPTHIYASCITGTSVGEISSDSVIARMDFSESSKSKQAAFSLGKSPIYRPRDMLWKPK